MRTLVSIIAFSLIVAVTAPAFAGTPKTEAACKKSGTCSGMQRLRSVPRGCNP